MGVEQNPAKLLYHTPAELATSYVKWVDEIYDGRTVPWGIPIVDKYILPMRAGELITIMARPGGGKTSLMMWLAIQEARRIQARGAQDTEAVVYCTWEQSAEELEVFVQSNGQYTMEDIMQKRVDRQRIREDSLKRAAFPLWTMGYGIATRGKLKVPRMTPDVVLKAIEHMEHDHGVRPSLMMFDYLQLVPTRAGQARTEQVSEATIRIKEVAGRLGTPAVAGVQARRDVDGYKDKMPRMWDAQHASSIEQTSDKMFGLLRPIMYMDQDAPFSIGKHTIPVTKELLLMKNIKQRGAAPGQLFTLRFDPAYLTLNELELRNVNEL